jgi:hypothetical protein
MYKNLKAKFSMISGAAQMNLWYQFMLFLIDPESPSAGIVSCLKDL